MFIIGIPIDDYRAGYFGAAYIAEEYVCMPEKPPMGMNNGKYGLEEYFELRIVTAKINGLSIKEAFAARPQHLKGMWDGFVQFVRAFRYYKVKTLSELEQKIMEYMQQQHEGQQREHSDIDDADYWKKGKSREDYSG